MHKRAQLTRSADGYIAGVCEGLGRRFGINPNILRIIWLAAVLFAGTGLLLYLVFWWIVPREDRVPAEAVIWKRRSDGHYGPPLQRTASDRKLLGVCGGLARWLEVDPSLLRLGVLSLAMVSFGLVAIAYLVAALVIPGPDAAVRSPVEPVEL